MIPRGWWVPGNLNPDGPSEGRRRKVESRGRHKAPALPTAFCFLPSRYHAWMAQSFNDLVALVDRLRRECPWDREQTVATLRTYLLEECHETLAAIDSGDTRELQGELGDLLFQVVFLARIASEQGWFDLEAVAAAVTRKMIERHPHVFGGAKRPCHEVKLTGQTRKSRRRRQRRRSARQHPARASGACRGAPANGARGGPRLRLGPRRRTSRRRSRKSLRSGERRRRRATGRPRSASWATCCCRSSTWRADAASMPRTPCARPTRGFRPSFAGVARRAAAAKMKYDTARSWTGTGSKRKARKTLEFRVSSLS